MKTMGGSYHNLAALAEAKFSDARTTTASFRSPLGMPQGRPSGSALSLDSNSGRTRWVLMKHDDRWGIQPLIAALE